MGDTVQCCFIVVVYYLLLGFEFLHELLLALPLVFLEVFELLLS